MLQRVITYVTVHPKRIILLWLVLAVGLAAAGTQLGHRVVTDDTEQFLPKSSESARATQFAETAFGEQEGTTTVTALVKRSDGRPLNAADRAEVAALSDSLKRWRVDTDTLDVAGQPGDLAERAGGIVAAAPGPQAPDGRFQLVGLQWKANSTDLVAQEAFRQIRDRAADAARADGLRVAFTGGIASTADQAKADEDSTALQGLLLLGAIVVLSLLFFRAPLAALVPLVSIYLVAGAAGGLVVLAALAFGFDLDVNTPQMIHVVLVGIGVDYFLFLLFRLRERLRAGDDRRAAAQASALRIGPVIASAALAVVVAFATLGLAEFGQFRVLGPAIAISVLFMLVAGVTLMPALAAVTGRALFWPSRRWLEERTDGPAARLGRGIAAHPGRTTLAVTLALVALATVAVGTKMSYDVTSGQTTTAATRAADEIAASLPKGATDPQHVYVDASRTITVAELEPLRQRLERVDGVGSVGTPVLTPDRRGAQIELALRGEALSKQAMDVVRGPLRDTAHAATPAGTTAMVGGTTAVFADVSDSVGRDMRKIFPIAAALIGLILVLTLRSAVAPLYLLGAVALEFAATLGASVLVFQVLAGQTGVAFTLPLVLFLFVVALGTDYNILMTARLREEMLAGRPVREAVAAAVRHVAPAIAAAGLVLAASFATLMLASGQASKELGFAMAFGIILASLVVSSILVPALTALAGRRAGWPGKAAGERRAAPARVGGSAPKPVG
ncbi:MAG TPA: MMPL family transporter [Solirubrobacteraceae bacterium]|nr:MMPL family transporter [Solirubrobacteraceae bacterium]